MKLFTYIHTAASVPFKLVTDLHPPIEFDKEYGADFGTIAANSIEDAATDVMKRHQANLHQPGDDVSSEYNLRFVAMSDTITVFMAHSETQPSYIVVLTDVSKIEVSKFN